VSGHGHRGVNSPPVQLDAATWACAASPPTCCKDEPSLEDGHQHRGQPLIVFAYLLAHLYHPLLHLRFGEQDFTGILVDIVDWNSGTCWCCHGGCVSTRARL
jgi:hypothetical protein